MKPSRYPLVLLALLASLAYPAIAHGDDFPTTAPAVTGGGNGASDTTAPPTGKGGPLSLDGSGDGAPQGPPGPPPPGFISGFVDAEFTTAYYKRGFLQENKGTIFEPITDISLNPFHSDGPLTSLSFNIGTRASIHSNDSHALGTPRAWYEEDFFGGINAVFIKRIKVDATYVCIDSPNNAFDTIHELDFQVTWLDDGLFGPVTFHPYVSVVDEIKYSAAGGPEGTYLELGVDPTFPVIQNKTFPVLLSFPTLVGLSTHNYYKLVTPFNTVTNDETFGYAQTGIQAMMPVTFIPHEFGMVFIKAGVDFMFLDHNLQLVNHGADNAVIGHIGIVWAF